MPALIDIYNMALRAASVAPLVSVDDASQARRDCDLAYAIERPALLRRHRWPFAIRRQLLSPTTETPAFGWRYRMRLPADLITVIAASPFEDSGREILTGEPDTYRVEGGDLLADTTPMHLVYVADVQNPTLFDSLFTQALADAIGSHVALSLTNDLQRSEVLRERSERRILLGRRANGVEQPPELIDTYGFSDSRGRFALRPITGRPGFAGSVYVPGAGDVRPPATDPGPAPPPPPPPPPPPSAPTLVSAPVLSVV